MLVDCILKKIITNMLQYKKNEVIIDSFVIDNKHDLEILLHILKNIDDLKISITKNGDLKFNARTIADFDKSISEFSKFKMIKMDKEDKFNLRNALNQDLYDYIYSNARKIKRNKIKNNIKANEVLDIKKKLDNNNLNWDMILNDDNVMFTYEGNYLKLNSTELKAVIKLFKNSKQIYIGKKFVEYDDDIHGVRICAIL